jgi:hypothetical protein
MNNNDVLDQLVRNELARQRRSKRAYSISLMSLGLLALLVIINVYKLFLG